MSLISIKLISLIFDHKFEHSRRQKCELSTSFGTLRLHTLKTNIRRINLILDHYWVLLTALSLLTLE